MNNFFNLITEFIQFWMEGNICKEESLLDYKYSSEQEEQEIDVVVSHTHWPIRMTNPANGCSIRGWRVHVHVLFLMQFVTFIIGEQQDRLAYAYIFDELRVLSKDTRIHGYTDIKQNENIRLWGMEKNNKENNGVEGIHYPKIMSTMEKKKKFSTHSIL